MIGKQYFLEGNNFHFTLFVVKDVEALYSQQKQDQELNVAHVMNSLVQNSDIHWRK